MCCRNPIGVTWDHVSIASRAFLEGKWREGTSILEHSSKVDFQEAKQHTDPPTLFDLILPCLHHDQYCVPVRNVSIYK